MIFLLISLLWSGQLEGIEPHSPDHAFYMGVVQINREAGAAEVKAQIKVFKDDLSDALRNAFNQHATIPHDSLCEHAELVSQYFKQHFECQVNGEALSWQLDACEIETDVCLLTFSAPCPNAWKTFELTGDFLMEVFPTQVNVVSLFNGDEKRFFRLTRSQPEQEVEFGR